MVSYEVGSQACQVGVIVDLLAWPERLLRKGAECLDRRSSAGRTTTRAGGPPSSSVIIIGCLCNRRLTVSDLVGITSAMVNAEVCVHASAAKYVHRYVVINMVNYNYLDTYVCRLVARYDGVSRGA